MIFTYQKNTSVFFSTSPLMFKVPQAHKSHRKLFINSLKTKIGENLRSGGLSKCVLFSPGSTVHVLVYIVLTLRYQSNHQRINDNMRKCQTRRANIRVWAVCKNHTHVHQNAHFTHPKEVHIAWNLRNKRTPQMGVLDEELGTIAWCPTNQHYLWFGQEHTQYPRAWH